MTLKNIVRKLTGKGEKVTPAEAEQAKRIDVVESHVAQALMPKSPTPRQYGEYLKSRPRRKLKGWQKKK